MIIVSDGLERAVSRESMSRLAMCDNVAARTGLAAEAEGYGLATPPPCVGRGAPLVVGNLIGNLRMKRTAKKANA